jgi:hypothetical protein
MADRTPAPDTPAPDTPELRARWSAFAWTPDRCGLFAPGAGYVAIVESHQ